MDNALQRILARMFLVYDSAYRLVHRLQPITEFLLINRAIYKGPERQFADGSILKTGDPIGIIHFNNEFMSRVQARSGKSSSKRAAFAFGAALIKSMHSLAEAMNHSPQLKDLKAISGITWFKAHGEKIGFEVEPLPPGRRKDFLRAHFRVLLRLLYPHVAARENHRLEPLQFWMTRNQLEKLVVSKDLHTVKRMVKYEQHTIKQQRA